MAKEKGKKETKEKAVIERAGKYPTPSIEELLNEIWEWPLDKPAKEIVVGTKNLSSVTFSPQEEQAITEVIETSEKYKLTDFSFDVSLEKGIGFRFKREPTVKKTIITKTKKK